jgi:hypothetical protein
MNPSSYKLSKDVLQQMIESDDAKSLNQFQSIYGSEVKGLSPSDQAQKHTDDFFDSLSVPLKKMQIEYLEKSISNCYQERHLSDTFTNLEKIVECKERERKTIWGKFEDMYVLHRDSGRCF